MLKVVCAIIVNKQKILATQLAFGSDRAYEWEFPGGKIDPGESAEAAIVREIREELWVDIRICKTMTTIIHNDGKKVFELIPFLCEIISGEVKLTEHNQICWICFEDVEKMNFSKADKQLIQHPENRHILKKYTGENEYKAC